MRYNFKQQLISGVAAAAMFGLGLAAVVGFLGGVNLTATITEHTSAALRGLTAFIILAAVVFAGIQQAMLRLVIYRK